MTEKHIAVIGAGASGLACAIEAARTAKAEKRDIKITVFEHLHKPLKKLTVTGNGRCNLSNTDISAENYHGSRALINAVLNSGFTDDEAFFGSFGLFFSVEDGRIYPRSMQASSVRDALLSEAAALGIKIITETEISSIEPAKSGFIINGEHKAGCVVIACGGKASPAQGSDGSIFPVCESLGHSFTKTAPALTAFLSTEKCLKELKGARVQAELSLFDGSRFLGSNTGEIQFTESSISGIPAFMLSHKAAGKNNLSVSLDLCPDYTEGELLSHLLKQKRLHPEYDAEAVLSGILPSKVCYTVIERSFKKKNAAMRSLGEAELKKTASVLKKLTFSVSGTRGFPEAQIMLGGINTDEINTETLMSKIHRGLFFCGEITDAAGDCGGYNLHYAWASGRLAAHSAVSYLTQTGK